MISKSLQEYYILKKLHAYHNVVQGNVQIKKKCVLKMDLFVLKIPALLFIHNVIIQVLVWSYVETILLWIQNKLCQLKLQKA